MNSTRISPLLTASVVLMLATACSSIDAAPPATSVIAESTTAAENDGGACRLHAINICPLPTTTSAP
ncbi:MAG: hypothetical protein ACXV5U_03290 [Ilumatobacteraceae bacterium]